MLFTKKYRDLIEGLPKKIKKDAIFISECRKTQEQRLNSEKRFQEIIKELETEFAYDPDKVSSCIGLKSCAEIRRAYSDFKLCKLQVEYCLTPEEALEKRISEIISQNKLMGERGDRVWETPDAKFKAYFGVSIMNLVLPEDKKELFEYNYNTFSFLRCVSKLYEIYFFDKYNFARRLSGGYHPVVESMDTVGKIAHKLNTNILINGEVCGDYKVISSLANEVRWILENNVNLKYPGNVWEVIFDEIDTDNMDAKDQWSIENDNDNLFVRGEKVQLTIDTDNEEQKKKNIGNIMDKLERGCPISKYMNPVYQARIIMNEKMKKILEGKGNAKSFGSRLKYLGFLRQGLTEYEAFVIEKQSRLYLSYIFQEGILKGQLWDKKDMKQLSQYYNKKYNILECQLERVLEAESIEDILEKIQKSWNDSSQYNGQNFNELISVKTQLILIMIRIISSIHSCDISLLVAKYVMEELKGIRYDSGSSVEKTLMEVDRVLYKWVKKFNCHYDFLLQVMVYIYSYSNTEKKLRWLKTTAVYPMSNVFKTIDNDMMEIYKNEMSESNDDNSNYRELKKRMISEDSDYTEQKILGAINRYIVHACYPEAFVDIMH